MLIVLSTTICLTLWSSELPAVPKHIHRLKITALDLSGIFLKTVKLGYEFKFSRSFGIEADAGYTYFSREENTKVEGYFSSLAGNFHLAKGERHRLIMKIMPFFHRIYLDHYLKYDTVIPLLGAYYDYRKTKYTKERYGVYLLACWQYDFSKHFFLETNGGIGIMRFVTYVKDQHVTQEFYRNGFFNGKEYYSPTITINLKLGYAF